MKYRIFLIFFSISIIHISCENKVDGVIVDEKLVPYFEQFRIEAKKRGIIFDNSVEHIEGYLQNITDNGVVGACRRSNDPSENKSVFIDKPYWNISTNLEREYVVFHELGHCFLGREHNEMADSNGVCVSIMASGLGDCIERYTEARRDMLLDELFGK